MPRRRAFSTLNRVFFLLVLGSFPASAQINRAFVSATNGNDANACNDIKAPCLTIQRGVDQVVAGASVIVLTTGDYGQVSIGKSVTIEAGLGVIAFIHATSGPAIAVDSSGGGASFAVVLRGLSLYGGPGDGIFWHGDGGVVRVERSVVHGFGQGVNVQSAGLLVVKDSTIRESSVSGISLHPSSGALEAVIESTRIKHNGSAGVVVKSGASATIRRSNVSGNASQGVISTHIGAGMPVVNVEDCVVAHNSVGVESSANPGSNAIARVSNSTIVHNSTGLGQSNADVLLTRSNNTIERNGIDLYGTITPYAAK